MTSRIAFESWQLVFPCIGFIVFVTVFLWESVRATRIKKPVLNHMLHLPMEDEASRPASHVRPEQ